MALELTGGIVKILPKVEGQSQKGPWCKQDFVIQTPGDHPKKVCLTAWGDKCDVLEGLAEGEEVKCSFNPESREYNERWYTELRAWKIDVVGSGASTGGSPQEKAAPPKQKPAPVVVATAEEEQDLPF